MTTHPASRTTFTDSAATLERALKSLFAGAVADTARDLQALFTPSFKHYDEDAGTVRDFAQWVEHVKWLRGMFNGGEIDLRVVGFLKDGNQRAERHIGNGGPSHTFQFMEVAEDGRIEWIVETVKHSRSVKEGN